MKMPSSHNHGNCELCDWIERELSAGGYYDEIIRLRAELIIAARDAARYRYWRRFFHARFALKLVTRDFQCRAELEFCPQKPPVEAAGEDYQDKVDRALDAAMAREMEPDCAA